MKRRTIDEISKRAGVEVVPDSDPRYSEPYSMTLISSDLPPVSASATAATNTSREPMPAGTKFFSVSGVPVAMEPIKVGAEEGFSCRAFDVDPPRGFSMALVGDDGVDITETEFMALARARLKIR